MIIIRGVTRTVVLFDRWAFKFPSLYSWEFFLRGLLANIQENNWWNWTNDDRLCPVIFCVPTGILLVMPKAKNVSHGEIPEFDSLDGLPRDYKLENFGKLNNKIVLIDYGS